MKPVVDEVQVIDWPIFTSKDTAGVIKKYSVAKIWDVCVEKSKFKVKPVLDERIRLLY